MGWLSPCLHRLILLCSQPRSLASQQSWCLRGCSWLPPTMHSPRRQLPTLLTPLVTAVQNPSSHRTQCWKKWDFPKHSYSPLPTLPNSKTPKQVFCYYFRASFAPYYNPFTVQHRSTDRVSGERWVFLIRSYAMATYVLCKTLRHTRAARPKAESYFARVKVCSSTELWGNRDHTRGGSWM